ncbi:MAG: response regulator [Desulfobacteraceae bacterium]|nr:response regulator [Desulfobacteraceae bacterium]
MSKVLIVDDDEDLLFLISEYLEAHGIEFEIASGVPQARKHLKTKQYRLIVSDFNMPGETGLDLYRYVSLRYPGQRFILMTGNSDPRLKGESLRLGIREFMEKPFHFSDLMHAIARPEAAAFA